MNQIFNSQTVYFKRSIITIIFFLIITSQVFAQNYIVSPEALTYDEKTERYFVANYNGTIVRIEKDGKQTLLVTGLEVCSGAHLIGDIIFSNCGRGLKTIKGFNVETGKEVFSLDIPEAGYLNDIVSDEKGKYLFLSDFNRAGGKIYRVNIAEKSYSVYLDNLYRSTCGMIYEKEKNRLMFMTGSSEKSLIQAVDLTSKKVTDLYTSTEYNSFDCLTKDNKGHYYASSWKTNLIYSFDENFKTTPEIVFTGGIFGPSGFEYIEKLDKLASPSMTDNNIDFLPLPSAYEEKNLNVYGILLKSIKEKGIEDLVLVFEKLRSKYKKIYDFDKKMLDRVAKKLLADKDFDNYIAVTKLNFKLYPKSKTLSEQIFIAAINNDSNEFKKLSDNLVNNKDKIYDENLLNNMGYQLLALPKLDEAINIFELNTKLFPNSANVFDSYAESLMMKGKNELSIKNYMKSLELNPQNENAKQQITYISRDEQMINVGEYNLSCISYGEKKENRPSIVLINGMNRDQKYWKTIIPEISKYTTVFTYDPLGIGGSDKGDYPPVADKEIKDLKILLEKREISEPYILVGHSFAGLYARLFASTYPEVTAGLILEDSTPIGFSEAILDIMEGDEKKTNTRFYIYKTCSNE